MGNRNKFDLSGFYERLLTLIYIGGGKFAPRQFFCYSSTTVGARLLKPCDFHC